jgi:Flp pilus assembly protein TadG
VCPGVGTVLGDSSLFDCAKVQIDVKTYTDFASISGAAPINNGQLDTSQMCYAPGNAGSIEVVRFYYEWPIYLSLLNNNLANLSNGSRLLVATAVFRNEPFGTSGIAGTCP